MIIGRFLGAFIVFVIGDLAINGYHGIERYFYWVAVAAIASVVGILISLFIGMQFVKDIPVMQDSLDYWNTVFPDDLETAELAHTMWLKSREVHHHH